MDSELGLKRHTVRLVDHRDAWARLYEWEAAEVLRVGRGLIVDVQHVGSTAVPGLPAKPILDIAIAVEAAEDVPMLVSRLVDAGYIDRGDAGRDGGHLLVRELAPDVRSVHAHVLAIDDPQWRDYLRFRDTLREKPDIRSAYAAVKAALAASHVGDRRAYTREKGAFIRRVLARAES